MRLFSYKMTSDKGFAPNPFFGILTLATCKPGIRESRNISDFVAGFTSKELDGSEVGKEKLIYIMKITGKLPYSKYWNAPEFQIKKPIIDSKELRMQLGDNIYEPIRNSTKYIQHENKCHNSKNEDTDLESHHVLLSDDFYYFGASSILLPEEFQPTIPEGETPYGYETKDDEKIQKLLDFLSTHYSKGIVNHPTQWEDGDISWIEKH